MYKLFIDGELRVEGNFEACLWMASTTISSWKIINSDGDIVADTREEGNFPGLFQESY